MRHAGRVNQPLTITGENRIRPPLSGAVQEC